MHPFLHFYLSYTSICALHRIGVAVDLVEEAADCVTSLGNLPLFCCLLVATFVLFSALWLLYTTYLVSSAEVCIFCVNKKSTNGKCR